jgi:hypothetical protein
MVLSVFINLDFWALANLDGPLQPPMFIKNPYVSMVGSALRSAEVTLAGGFSDLAYIHF